MKHYFIIVPLLIIIAAASSMSLYYIDQSQARIGTIFLRNEEKNTTETTSTETSSNTTSSNTDTTNTTISGDSSLTTSGSGEGSSLSSGSGTATGTTTDGSGLSTTSEPTSHSTDSATTNTGSTPLGASPSPTGAGNPGPSSSVGPSTGSSLISAPAAPRQQPAKTVVTQQQKSAEKIQAVSQTFAHVQKELQLKKTELRSQVEESFNETLKNVSADSSVSDETVKKLTATRKEVLQDLDKTFSNNSPIEVEKNLKNLTKKIDTALTPIDSDAVKRVRLAVNGVQDVVAKNKIEFEQRGGLKVYTDTDKDGISDYDEEVIYQTDPRKAFTVPGELTDGEKILRGLDPRSTSTEPIRYEEPETASLILETLAVSAVEPHKFISSPDGTDDLKELVFKGKALPNSIITLYIYSTPIIVAVKTDSNGDWTYVLDQELEDGDHKVYAAVVNNSGKVLARSNAVPFVKQASAITVDQADITKSEEAKGGFMRKYFFWISGSIVLLGLILTLIIVGLLPKGRDSNM
jgi:hypothetical protein